ncbi:MAG: tRNA (adenosine(37)-N6)-threonylcarbamoyltransferase complex dimerization subunit type 1 TsaB [Saprospiraceae bacterium]|nr:tRNA (adenosine(37)-N6)-threonylcarbamoyltransferase complex dimerization subunit type 1 TsaB [Saprospiraceae bacterium]
MAKILLIETSSEVCSAGIGVDGKVVALSENVETQSHAALLTLQIRECTESAGIPLALLDAVALSRGPGAYTALRVGASVAKGICYALEKPLIAIDTLLALAHATREAEFTVYSPQSNVQSPTSTVHSPTSNVQHPTSSLFVPMLDARRQEVWLAVYGDEMQGIMPAQPLILENNSFEKLISEKTGGAGFSGIILAGNGMEKFRSGGFSEKVRFSAIHRSSARHLGMLAEQFFQNSDFQDIAYFEPFYMKPPNITTPGKPPF